MKKFVKFLAVFCFLFYCSSLIYAQKKTFDLNAAVPFDTGTIKGKLNNGITYYIRTNNNPLKRGEFYLVVNAGSILESDAQNGLAHFCEHMAFNGTKNFKKHQIIHYLQSIGMKFGPEINAFTMQDVTNFMLQKVPTENPLIVDTALMILYDWACNVSYENSMIDGERGVIHEEWRTGRDAETRMRNNYLKSMFYNSKYALRNTIGDINNIDKCPYDTLKKFYQDWYRPDLEAVIAIGDFNAKEVEKKIIDLFSTIPKREVEKPRTVYDVPDHDQTIVDVEKDKEAKYTIGRIFYMLPPAGVKNMSYMRTTALQQLINIMLNERMGELLDDENPPFLYAGCGYTSLVPKKNAYISMFYAKNNEFERGLRTVLEENERVKRFGFVITELQRAKAELSSDLEQQYNERNKRKSSEFANEYFDNFLNNEPSPGVDFEYEFFKSMISDITLDEVNNLAKSWITDKNRVVIVTGPESPDIKIPDVDKVERWVNSFNGDNLKPYVDKISNKPLVPDELMPVAGKVDKTAKDDKTQITEWTLKNGAKVVIKPTDFKTDEILLSAYSLGGISLYPDKDVVSAMITDDVIDNSGIGQFSKTELSKMLAGKIVTVNPFINDLQQGFTGSSSPKDFETMLQLLYLYFTSPHKDEKAYKSFYSRQKGLIENRANDPQNAFRDTIQVTMNQHNPRKRPWTLDLLNEADYNRVQYIFRDRFTDASGFTFIFVGNIDVKKAKPLIEKYIGGLPALNRNEKWKDVGIRPPKGVLEKNVYVDMKDAKSLIYICYSGNYDYAVKNRINLDALSDIIEVRLLETIREEEGGTYSPGVWVTQSQFPQQEYQLNIYFEADPAKVDRLVKIVFEQLKKIKDEGPLAKDVSNVIENKEKEFKENLRENKWWLETIKNHYYHNLDYDGLLNYENNVKELSVQSVKETADKFLNDNNFVKIVLYPSQYKK